jgi:hypothetical protein
MSDNRVWNAIAAHSSGMSAPGRGDLGLGLDGFAGKGAAWCEGYPGGDGQR